LNNKEKFSNRIISACRRLGSRGLCYGPGGNISFRLPEDGLIICSPSGIPLAEMTPSDLCVVKIRKENEIDTNNYFNVISGKYKPTSEINIHCMIYMTRPDISAVIHLHPIFITALSCTEEGIDFDLTEDRKYYIGNIGFVPFLPGGSPELTKEVARSAQDNNLIICENHGIFTLGSNLSEAVNVTELAEGLAKLDFVARISTKKKIKFSDTADMTGYGDKKRINTSGSINTETDLYESVKSSLIYRDEIFDN